MRISLFLLSSLITGNAFKVKNRIHGRVYRCSEENAEVSDISEVSKDVSDIKRVRWTANSKGSALVKEGFRTAEEYMALPASEYSVLSAEQIERLNDREFRCILGTMNFFGTKITPILYVDVNVIPQEHKSIISVIRAETTGSETAIKVNGTFSISAINTVTVGKDKKDRKTLNSQTELKVDCIVPSDSRLPLRVIEKGGNFLMQSSLTVILQAFVRILASDFKRWSEGNDSRDALEGERLN
mmetsp:Transcript_33925/g.34559  ORF Transcript_33925/g.34559 Transcript_33925/m.34559 type:complete len:242 (+) Transcript_33925:106-831(+)